MLYYVNSKVLEYLADLKHISHAFACRMIIITLIAVRVPASVQLADKNKSGCKSIQFLK